MKVKETEYKNHFSENYDIENGEYLKIINPYDLTGVDVGLKFLTLSKRCAIYCGDVINYVNKYGYNNCWVIKLFVDLSTGNFFILRDCNRGHSDGNTFDRGLFDKYSHGFNMDGLHIDEYLAP